MATEKLPAYVLKAAGLEADSIRVWDLVGRAARLESSHTGICPAQGGIADMRSGSIKRMEGGEEGSFT